MFTGRGLFFALRKRSPWACKRGFVSRQSFSCSLTKAGTEHKFLIGICYLCRSEKSSLEGGSQMEVIKQDRNIFKGLLIGTLVGAAAGTVFAPKSGRELRSDIKGEGEKAIREAKRFYSGARAKADAVFESAKDIFGGRERSNGMILKDLEEPEEFTAEA